MTDINRIILTGNVGKEPEFKYFESGAVLTTFTLAVNRYDNKIKSDVVDWLNIKTFSKLSEYIQKGFKVAIDGKLMTNTWKNEQGENRKAIYIQADSIQILTPRAKTDENEEEILINDEEIPF